jgi:2-oxoglutarate ferredoxin oxidoreductase subunit gamma
MDGRKVAWIPSYGPEMRGGTASCTVVIGDEDVGSLVVLHPSAAIVMNPPSLDKYEPAIKPNGVLVVNTSLGGRAPDRSDLRIVSVDASKEAIQSAGNDKLANMVALGCLLPLLPAVSAESVLAALKKVLGTKKANLYEANESALRRGIELGKARLA